jgi:hypothetical protein
MLDWLEDALLYLSHSAERIFLEFFCCENFIDIFTEIHPFYSFFSTVDSVDSVHSNQFFILIFC